MVLTDSPVRDASAALLILLAFASALTLALVLPASAPLDQRSPIAEMRQE